MQSYDGMSAMSPPTRHDDADVFGETSYRNMIFTWICGTKVVICLPDQPLHLSQTANAS